LQYAVAGRLREQALQVGDILEELLPPGSAGLEVTIHTPDGRSATTTTQATEDGATLRFTETDQSGVYRITIGQHPRDHLFAVNVPTANPGQQGSESNLT